MRGTNARTNLSEPLGEPPNLLLATDRLLGRSYTADRAAFGTWAGSIFLIGWVLWLVSGRREGREWSQAALDSGLRNDSGKSWRFRVVAGGVRVSSDAKLFDFLRVFSTSGGQSVSQPFRA